MVRARDAINQAKKEAQRLTFDQKDGFISIKGKDAVDRKSGKALSDEYGEMLDTSLTKIGEGLSNPQQRQMFSEAATALSMGFRENTQKHFITEFNNYRTDVNKTEAETSLEQIKLNPLNSALVAAETAQIRAAFADQGKLTGASKDAIEMDALKVISPVHRANIAAMLDEKKYKSAEAYFKEHIKDIMATDRDDIEKAIAEEQRLGFAIEIVDKALLSQNGGPAALAAEEEESADPDGPPAPPKPRLTSRNASYKDLKAFVPNLGRGYTITSGYRGPDHELTKANPNSAHAKGLAIDVTAPSNKQGRDPAAFNRTVEQYRRAGFSISAKNEYLDPAKWSTGGHWHIELVAEDGRSQPAKPSKMDNSYRVTQQEFIDRALKLAGLDIDPRMRLAIEERASKVWGLQNSAFKQRQEENLLGVMRYLVDNGGDVTTLPRSALMNISADKIPAIQQFAMSISDNNRNLNPNKDVLYYDLSNNPEELMNMPESKFFGLRYQMPEAMWQRFNDQRIALKDARDNPDTSKTKMDVLDSEGVKRVFGQAATLASLDPNAKDKRSVTRLSIARQAVDAAILVKQRDVGRQLSDTEMTVEVNKVAMTTYTYDTMFGSKTETLFNVTENELPAAERKRIVAGLKKATGLDPTPEQIERQFYFERLNLFAPPPPRPMPRQPRR